jgi:hypothetical protein
LASLRSPSCLLGTAESHFVLGDDTARGLQGQAEYCAADLISVYSDQAHIAAGHHMTSRHQQFAKLADLKKAISVLRAQAKLIETKLISEMFQQPSRQPAQAR